MYHKWIYNSYNVTDREKIKVVFCIKPTYFFWNMTIPSFSKSDMSTSFSNFSSSSVEDLVTLSMWAWRNPLLGLYGSSSVLKCLWWSRCWRTQSYIDPFIYIFYDSLPDLLALIIIGLPVQRAFGRSLGRLLRRWWRCSNGVPKVDALQPSFPAPRKRPIAMLKRLQL